MSDSRYVILESLRGERKISLKDNIEDDGEYIITPTYTLPELLYKLPEYLPGFGELNFYKDSPYYCFRYGGEDDNWEYYDEYPIVAAARLLLRCSKEGKPYVDDISGK